MASLKLTLDKRRKYQDGRSPVILRLTQNGKSTSIQLGVKILHTEWDDHKQKVIKKHQNQQDLNLALKNRLLDYEQKLVSIETNQKNLSLVELRDALTNEKSTKPVLFRDFALEHVAHLKNQERYGNAEYFLTATNRIIDFAGSALKLSAIDYAFIQNFEAKLATDKLSANSIAAYMRALRAILNKAGKLGVYDSAKYPFRHYTIRTHKTASRAETIETIKQLADLQLETASERFHARNIFLLIFSLIGISFVDLITLKKTDLRNNRILYKRKKTGKLYSIKVTPLVRQLFDLYHQDNSEYLLPQFGLDGTPKSRLGHLSNLGLKSTNRYLKHLGVELKLATTLTTYVARYSWANIAKRQGYSKDLIAEALGHNYGNSVTGIYLENYGDEVIDEANQRIVALISNN